MLRSQLRKRLEGNLPPWCRSGNWEAHHIIPVEFQSHELFELLRRHGIPWDHHNPLNGIPLPKYKGINGVPLDNNGKEILPLHQAQSSSTGRRGKSVEEWLDDQEFNRLKEEGFVNDDIATQLQKLDRVRGHPIYNAEILSQLDELYFRYDEYLAEFNDIQKAVNHVNEDVSDMLSSLRTGYESGLFKDMLF